MRSEDDRSAQRGVTVTVDWADVDATCGNGREVGESRGRFYKVDDAARETGLESALAERIVNTAGFNTDSEGALREEDVELPRHAASGLAAGLPMFVARLRREEE